MPPRPGPITRRHPRQAPALHALARPSQVACPAIPGSMPGHPSPGQARPGSGHRGETVAQLGLEGQQNSAAFYTAVLNAPAAATGAPEHPGAPELSASLSRPARPNLDLPAHHLASSVIASLSLSVHHLFLSIRNLALIASRNNLEAIKTRLLKGY
jgi:hypothetical protein